MTLSKTFVAAVSVTLLMGGPSAFAQQRGGGGQRGEAGGGARAASPRSSAPRSAGAPRASAPRAGAQRPSSPRSDSSARAVPRSYSYAAPRAYAVGPRGGWATPGRMTPRMIGPRSVRVAPLRFYSPYYAFRPRISLGFGLWVGFPISYPSYYGYYDPYDGAYGYNYPYSYPAYRYPYPSTGYPTYGYPYPPTGYPAYGYPSPSTGYPAYGYPSPSTGYPAYAPPQSAYPAPPAGSVQVQPRQTQADMGGVSFEITPSTAELFVDGLYVGTTGEFTPQTQPLGLTPGRHRIEIRAPGYRTLSFDVDTIAGQVLPYRGALQR
jgi:hypothetical protein